MFTKRARLLAFATLALTGMLFVPSVGHAASSICTIHAPLNSSCDFVAASTQAFVVADGPGTVSGCSVLQTAPDLWSISGLTEGATYNIHFTAPTTAGSVGFL